MLYIRDVVVWLVFWVGVWYEEIVEVLKIFLLDVYWMVHLKVVLMY